MIAILLTCFVIGVLSDRIPVDKTSINEKPLIDDSCLVSEPAAEILYGIF